MLIYMRFDMYIILLFCQQASKLLVKFAEGVNIIDISMLKNVKFRAKKSICGKF